MVSEKKIFLSLFQSEIQDGRHLENLFCASPELKGQLTRNLVEGTWATCRAKIPKIV